MPKNSHSIYQLYYHIVLSVKYRKKLLAISKYEELVKSQIKSVADKYKFKVEKMESDKDHIHILVSLIKQYTTYELWQKYPNELRYEFWKDHVFWNRGNFIASIGSVSKEAIEKYIENQKCDSSSVLKDKKDSRTKN